MLEHAGFRRVQQRATRIPLQTSLLIAERGPARGAGTTSMAEVT
jgi:hypothetical protein